MKSSFNPAKKSINGVSKRTPVFLLVFILLFSFLFLNSKPVKAQMGGVVSAPILESQNVAQSAYEKAKTALSKLLLKAGATSYQQVLRTALNKIAYDTATYLGSGKNGQKPLFITQGWGEYLGNVSDAAIGQFIETFAVNLGNNIGADCQKKYQICSNSCRSNYSASSTDAVILEQLSSCITKCKELAYKCGSVGGGTGSSGSNYLAGIAGGINAASLTSLNICQPSSLEAKVKIGLGLVEQQEGRTVNCTASEMVQNWGDEAQKLTDFKKDDFLDNIKDIFDPTTSDLGIYMSARTDMATAKVSASTLSLNSLVANKGWLDNTNAAGELIGVPGDAERKAETTAASQNSSLLRTTGDIVVDAANVFVNQYAITKFNTLMSQLGKKATQSSGRSSSLTNSESDPSVSYSAGNIKESAITITEPQFGTKIDYNILASLSVCSDVNNPGPTECVIDSKFMQAIAENKTVIEAINEGNGYINGNWQLTKDTVEGAYSLRSISILRKYRILPVGWEEAINRAYADPNNIKKVTVMDLISCFDDNDSYNQFSENFKVNEQSWCRGLVDPNWVLKAPLNYCSKEGVGAQILSKMVTPSIQATTLSSYVKSIYGITRGEDYCADEKTCIKEKADGSCEAYGYCNEEKRTWNFSTDSCDPVYNTCQSFTNSDSGKNVSYLKNTLNYQGCNAESAGCRQYSTFGAYSSDSGTVNWDAGKSVYLNKNTAACNSGDEACTELLRIKPTWGSNLVMDSDYNNENIGDSASNGAALKDWSYRVSANAASSKITIVDSSLEPGGSFNKSLKLEAVRATGNSNTLTATVYSDVKRSLLPDNFQLVAGQAYTVSVDVYLASGNKATVYMGGTLASQSTNSAGSWQHLTATRIASSIYNEAVFGISVEGSSDLKLYIKNLKFEVSNYETGFNLYGSTYKVYEKLLPPYLESVCYNNISSATKDYTLKDNAPEICNNFARRCNREEAGCEKFTGVKDGVVVSAQVTASDYCWGNCVGYNVFISKENYFNSPKAENMIPANAVSCDAESAGCNEFTNLDELAAGGEAKEYYSSMKQCIKPGQGTCGTFYSWEGTTSGYQLRSYTLQQDSQGNPKVTADDSAVCNQKIYNKSISDFEYNADCREFYNSSGQITYHLISKTITCSDNCHAYRMSEKNIDKTLVSQNACIAADAANDPGATNYHWDATAGTCYACLNGGVWDTETGSCIYQAIPGEGKTCAANKSGCREYNGNSGNNVRTATYFDFEGGEQGWTSSNNNIQVVSIANEKDGHSLLYSDKGNSLAAVNVSNYVSEGKSYSLRFLAKADSATNLNIYFTDNNSSNPKKAQFSAGNIVVKSGGEWNIYQASLASLDHAISGNETLTITADNDFYFDDFVLTEITDRYYLVSGTGKAPDICSYDLNNVYQGSDYSLGCSQYKDRIGEIHNLRKFSKLCSSSAVGCEQVIATQNYSPYGSEIWNDTNGNGFCDSDEKDCVKVDRDEAIYAVFDSSKQCNSADLGCSLLGQSAAGGSAWSDVYKVNNPNLYNSILCGQKAVGCEAWTTEDGSVSYFRDPGNETCQYRESHDPSIVGKSWYLIPTKKCDISGDGSIDTDAEKKGAVCANDNACSGKKCIVDNNDYPCQTTYFKTFGLGGFGNQVPVPSEKAGLCQATASGCTEYIDPVSKFSINLYNDKKTITISPNKLYILSVSGGKTATELTFKSGVKELLSDNSLGTTTKNLSLGAKTSGARLMFASLGNSELDISEGEGGTIELKEAVVNYQLQENIDTTSCNGAVNFNNGCILFNERSINGASGLASLVGKFDAVSSVDQQAPVNCSSSGMCNANKLIKVSPNRICSKWLDCRTYVNDPDTGERVCYSVGECSRLDDKNECANFEDAPEGTVKFDNSGQNKNASGYYLLNKYHLSNMQEVGLNTDAHYDFEDSAPALSCKRVSGGECSFSKNISSDLLVSEPEGAPTDYPAHGASYLKVPVSYLVSPLSSKNTISVKVDQQYYLNFLTNTKNSGANARVIIVSVSGNTENTIVSQDFSANTGWSRQVLPFASPTKDIKIYLGASDSSGDRAVYFDDLNIEPVLKVGDKQYIARECRLYPTNDSLTCINKNNNVLDDGWEGYCLEHDPDNKNVCLMWYPVDKISSERTLKTSSGYQGTFPLNYCTEVDGNFDLIKKVKGAAVSDINNRMNKTAWDNSGIYNPENDCKMWVGCLDAYDENYITIQHGEFAGDTYCIPNPAKIKYFKTEASGIETSGENLASCLGAPVLELYASDGAYGATGMANSKTAILQTDGTYCEAGGNSCRSYQDLTSYTDPITGIGNFSQFIRTVGNEKKFVYQEGWVEYNGMLQKISACSGDECSKINEETNAIPPVQVYNHNFPPADEDGLKYISGNDEEKIFRLTCNNFIQTVDPSGANMAWSVRVGMNSPHLNNTPPFFVDKNSENKYIYYGSVADGNSYGSEHGISGYGRNRETTPFGAASWPDSLDLLNSEAIKLKNQFSAKNNENILAGRPYGCSNYKPTDQGGGCSNIGYCSLDPSVYCLTGASGTTDYVSKKTCSDGGFGVCLPLWNNYLGKRDLNNNGLSDYRTILQTLFLKSYNSYSLSGGSYVSGDLPDGKEINQCPNNKRPEAVYGPAASSTAAYNSMCYVSPGIGNISLNNQAASAKVSTKGVYGLRFTTVIDPEQQPLKEIYIDWGDGFVQLFTGQESHPSASNPHVFYHYYKESPTGNIIIEIKDNWGTSGKGTLKLNQSFQVLTKLY